ncbi:MAG: 3-deoxy-manno-octulosonate cytidylyltransferase [Planctomycetota bacterium]|nr:3-deoxy-manno-octulosonate cytidylyltransferase [Planctomycetota bacterium]
MVLIVIPARLGSTRLERKMLLEETGKYLIQHTYEAAKRARCEKRIIVATDSEEIVRAAERFGAEVMMTSKEHRCGSERVAEVAQRFSEYSHIINLQGDEAEIESDVIDSVAEELEKEEVAPVVTAAASVIDPVLLSDPAVVKVATDKNGYALYFSRSEIPYERNFVEDVQPFLAHIGIYGYKRDFLLEFVGMERTPLERVEDLEQLRVLENGFRIKVVRVLKYHRGIDTMQDYRAFVERYRGETKK